MACKCGVCERIRSWKARGVPDDVIDYILDLEFDKEYWEAIKSGNWPSGEEALKRYLKNYE